MNLSKVNEIDSVTKQMAHWDVAHLAQAISATAKEVAKSENSDRTDAWKDASASVGRLVRAQSENRKRRSP